jgi:hypothetical protein
VRPAFVVAPAWRVRSLRTASAAALTIGYLDLARGGTTVAPILLVVAYLVLVPLTIVGEP